MKPKKTLKRKRVEQPAEIKFDAAARQEFLTGFHKRKLQRAQHARETAAKKEREDRIKTRKLLREEKQTQLQKHVEAVNSMIASFGNESSDEDGWEEKQRMPEWRGFADPIGVDHEDEFSDEDRHTTVTVEAVEVTRQGLEKIHADSENSDSEEAQGESNQTAQESSSNGTPKAQAVTTGGTKRVWTKENPNKGKKKRKKFKYESKVERKATRVKERAGNRAEAKARRQRA